MTPISVGQLQQCLLRSVATARPADALAFLINGKEVGLIVSTFLPFFHTLPATLKGSLIFSPTQIELRCPASEVNDRLAKLGRHWHAIGALSRWCDELLDVVTYDGRHVAKAERAMFRFLGMTTTCVHGVGMHKGSFLMSLRSHTKLIQPGKWDTLVGGLVSAGESPLQALERETIEEAGLVPGDYRVGPSASMLFQRLLPEGWLREFSITYPLHLVDSVVARNMDGEVERIESVDFDTVLDRIADNRLTVEAALSFLSILSDQ